MKHLSISVLVLLIAVCGVATSSAQSNARTGSIVIHSGFHTLGDFKRLTKGSQIQYAMGYVDGLFASVKLGADQAALEIFNNCILSMDNEQIAAIINKYADDHPEQWDYPCTSAVSNALSKVCSARGIQIQVPPR